MKVYTFDEIFKKARTFGAKDIKKRKTRTLSVPEQHQLRIVTDNLRNPMKGKFLGGPTGDEAKEIYHRLTGKEWMEKSNKNEVDDLIQKAKKKGGPDWERVKGAIAWTGEHGFDECVAGVSKKHGLDRAKKICGALKREARNKGELSPEHMGRLERKAYKAKKGKK